MTRGWLVIGLLLAGAPVAAQQQAVVRGRVRVVRSPDTAAVARNRVVLHRVGPATQGPIDSTETDDRGRFRFGYARDSTANYLLSASYADIQYFSSPLARGTGAVDTTLDLLVFDTSFSAPISTSGRTIVVAGPDAIGARTVVDWLTITNVGTQTKVGRDSVTATWGTRLPTGVRNTGLGDPRFSQISPDAVLFRNDSVLVTAPLAPGQKELVVQYELPRGARTLALDFSGVDSVDLFVEERGVRDRAGGWEVGPSQPFQGRTFHRLVRATARVEAMELRLPGGGIAPGPALIVLVGALGVGLLGATAFRWRRNRKVSGHPAPDTVAELTERIARLDRAAADRADPALGLERERLMTELRHALAARRPDR